jgi:hypothetical protein
MRVRASGVLNLPSGTFRAFQFAGSRYLWAMCGNRVRNGRRELARPHNDNGRRLSVVRNVGGHHE